MIQAPRDCVSGVFLIGKEIEYRDGGESEVAKIISTATDCTSHSDELNLAIHDWPTCYHLSSARSNILRLFRWQPSHSILEVGAGCGALTRYLGETGAAVDAVEGSLERARITARRCSGLARVNVAAGRLQDLAATTGYDVATLIGVLEYCGRYGSTPEQFLAQISSLLHAQGILILAIENQLGLKYLMGYAEDHLGKPFAGIEGYDPDEGVRTFSRAMLARLLKQAGFNETEWFYPFPDYKLPTAILRHTIASNPAYADLCVELIRTPVLDYVSVPLVNYDVRKALRVWAAADLLPDVSNSFLVVAGKKKGSLAAFLTPDVALWQFTYPQNRLSIWATAHLFGRRQREEGDVQTFTRKKTGGRLLEEVRSVSISGSKASPRRKDWLQQIDMPPRPFRYGRNLLDLARVACFTRDINKLRLVLLQWKRFLDSQALAQVEETTMTHNPFSGFCDSSAIYLPGRMLDLNLDNFIVDGTTIHYIDLEWSTDGPVSRDAVGMRALWYLADHLCEWGTHPWKMDLSRFDLTGRLCSLADFSYSTQSINEMLVAESQLQALVVGRPAQVIADQLRGQGERRIVANRQCNIQPSETLAAEAGIQDNQYGYAHKLLPFIEKWRPAAKRIVIFGIGPHTDYLFAQVPELETINLVGYIDSNKDVHGKKYRDKKVHPIPWAEVNADVVLCSSFVHELQMAAAIRKLSCQVVASHAPLDLLPKM